MIFYYGSSSKLIQGPQLGTGALGYEFILQKKKVIQGHERRAHSQVGPGVRSMGTSGNFWKPENEGFSSSGNLCLRMPVRLLLVRKNTLGTSSTRVLCL